MSAINIMKGALRRARQLTRTLFHTPADVEPVARARWSIGIYDGSSPFKLTPSRHAQNPVLTHAAVTDVSAEYVADPFMVDEGQTWFMFFEVLNQQRDKGEIGLAVSEDGLAWRYQHIVLAEPFHLSYPYIFKHAGDYYMIPESWQAGAVRLYRAARFPSEWVHVETLLTGPYFADSSIFSYCDRWWMFTETNPELKHDTLRLYYAGDLAGPWREHPQSPIVDGDAHLARPGGRVLVENGRLIRYAQDDYPTYGQQVRAFEISEMTTRTYSEREVSPRPVLTASRTGWNGCGMHHIDAHRGPSGQWRACVDGKTYE